MVIEANGIKKDKETHTPMLKVFKDLMRIKNDDKEDPERTSLLDKKYVDNNVKTYHTKNMDSERLYSDTSYSAPRGSAASPRKRQGIEICDSLNLRRYGKSEVKREKRKSEKEEKSYKAEKCGKHRCTSECKGQTLQLGRRESSKCKYKKVEKPSSCTSDGSCYIKKLIQAADCQALLLMLLMAVSVACALGYFLKGIETKKQQSLDPLRTLNHGTVKSMKHKPDDDYNVDDDDRLNDDKKDPDNAMLKDWSFHKYDMNNVEFADSDEHFGDNYNEKYPQSKSDFDTINMIQFDYEHSNSKLKNFYSKLMQIDSTIEKLKSSAKSDSYLRAKRSLRLKRLRRHRIKINNTITDSTKEATSSGVDVRKETGLLQANNTEQLTADTAKTIAANDDVVLKVVVQPGRKSKCSHVNTVNPKSHEKELKHPYYKMTQRVDELLDPKAVYELRTTNNDEEHLRVTGKVEKVPEKDKENLSGLKSDATDTTDISMDYYMGLPIMYFDYKDSSPRNPTKSKYNYKTNMRSLQQADDSYDDTMQYEELETGSNDKGASLDYKTLSRDKAVNMDKPVISKIHQTNWKGPMALYPDEVKAILQKVPKSQEFSVKNIAKLDKIDDFSANYDENANKDDVQYIEDSNNDNPRIAQCYSDYGVLDNEKKEIKFNKNSLFTKIPITEVSLTVFSSKYNLNEKPKYVNDKGEKRIDNLAEVFPPKQDRSSFHKKSQDSNNDYENLIKYNKNDGPRRHLMFIDDTGNIENELIRNDPRPNYDDYDEYLSYDYAPATENDLYIDDHSNVTNRKSNLKDVIISNERSKRDTTENIRNTDAIIETKETVSSNTTESLFNSKYKKESQSNANETNTIKNNRFVNFVTSILSSLTKTAHSKKENCSCMNRGKKNTTNDIAKYDSRRLSRVPLLVEDEKHIFSTTFPDVSEKNNENLSISTDAFTNVNMATTDTVNKLMINETRVPVDDKDIKDNKSIVKRDASIADSGFIFWNELYDDNYGIDSDLAEEDKADAGRHRRNKTGVSTCRGWIHDRINNIKNRLHFRVMKKHEKNEKGVSDQLHSGENDNKKNTEHFVFGKRVERDANPDISYRSATDSTTGSSHDQKEEHSKVSFSKLTANLKEVCKQAAQAVRPASKVRDTERNDGDGRNNLIMNQLVKMMTNMIDEQVEKKTCLSLPKDLQKFLNQLTARDLEKEEDPTLHRKAKEKHQKNTGLKVNPTELDVDPSLDHKSQCLEILREVQELQAEYEGFTDEEKQLLLGAKEYLDDKQTFILDQLQDHSLPTPEAQPSRFRKETYRHRRPIIFKRNAFKFIKKSSKKRTRSTSTDSLSTEPLEKSKTHDAPEQHGQVKRHDDEVDFASHDALESERKSHDTLEPEQQSHDISEFGRERAYSDNEPNYEKRNLKDVYFKAMSEANKIYSTIKVRHRKSYELNE